MRHDNDFIDSIDRAVEPALLWILGGFAAYVGLHLIVWILP